MTGSSGHVLSSERDPLKGKPARPPEARSWKLVLLLLLGLPLLSALVLARWLETPRESFPPSEVFSRLGLPEVSTTSMHSLSYGNLFFIRMTLDDEPRKDLLRSLTGFEVSRGEAEKPIALELEREWWSPPRKQQGTTWTREDITVWNPDSEPETFYAVVLQGKAGTAAP